MREKASSVGVSSPAPEESARIVGLSYVSGNGPGISRERRGKGFAYRDANGKLIRDVTILRRIRLLVIPPGWRDVWICPLAHGHLQATGYDSRTRKQYRYHPRYRTVRDATKFSRMIAFGTALPQIRQQVELDLKERGLSKRKVLATVVRLLETTCIRVGNEEYAKDNHSFGLTTLRNRHVHIEGRTLHFKFRGKSGQEHDIELQDRQLARIVQRLHNLPGYDLFEYLDDSQRPVKVASEDVNQYLREISGDDFTAKDFRTWMGTCLAALALQAMGECKRENEVKRNIVSAIKETAKRLGNRPSACRKYYVHPGILDGYTNGRLFAALRTSKSGDVPNELRRAELCVMSLVKNYDEKQGSVRRGISTKVRAVHELSRSRRRNNRLSKI